MPDIFRHIRKVFSKSSLRDENWLDPSDQVFANIEAEILKEDKKDKPVLLIFAAALLILIGLPLLFFFNNPDKNRRVEKVVEQSTIAGLKRDNTQTSESKLSAPLQSQKKASESNSFITQTSKNIETPVRSVKVAMTNRDKLQNDFKTAASGSSSIEEPNIPTEYTLQSSPMQPIINNEIIASNITTSPEQKKSKIIDSNENAFVDNYDDKANNNTVLIQNVITKLPLLNSEVFMPASSIADALNGIEVPLYNPWVFTAGFGYTNWQFNLNDAFESAVEPAAYENSDGNGSFVFIEVGKALNKKIGLSAQFNHQSARFSSGHNSQLNVDNSLTSQSQVLTMATPLGFIDNEVLLLRSDAPSTNEESLMVDLHNNHTISSVEFNLLADVQLMQKAGFKISIQPGIGLSQILKVTNELAELNTNNTNYTRGENVYTGEFENLNKTSPVATLNVNLLKSFSNDIDFGLQLTGKRNLNPIQETGDFKTNVQRFGAILFVRKSF